MKKSMVAVFILTISLARQALPAPAPDGKIPLREFLSVNDALALLCSNDTVTTWGVYDPPGYPLQSIAAKVIASAGTNALALAGRLEEKAVHAAGKIYALAIRQYALGGGTEKPTIRDDIPVPCILGCAHTAVLSGTLLQSGDFPKSLIYPYLEVEADKVKRIPGLAEEERRALESRPVFRPRMDFASATNLLARSRFLCYWSSLSPEPFAFGYLRDCKKAATAANFLIFGERVSQAGRLYGLALQRDLDNKGIGEPYYVYSREALHCTIPRKIRIGSWICLDAPVPKPAWDGGTIDRERFFYELEDDNLIDRLSFAGARLLQNTNEYNCIVKKISDFIQKTDCNRNIDTVKSNIRNKHSTPLKPIDAPKEVW